MIFSCTINDYRSEMKKKVLEEEGNIYFTRELVVDVHPF